ncbi:MAG: hypothetical protein ACE5NW_03825 [Acidiferrobacterales bacterium]
MNPAFQATVCSDQNYEDLIVEIYFEDQLIALINQDKGLNALEINLYPRKDGEPWHFELAELEKIIEVARRRLANLRRTATRTD